MVLFGELSPYGPLPRFAQRLANQALDRFRADARRLRIGLTPGTMFEKAGDGRIYEPDRKLYQGSLMRTDPPTPPPHPTTNGNTLETLHHWWLGGEAGRAAP